MNPPPPLHIRLLGGLQLLLDHTPLDTDVPIRTFISNKVPALFAYLAVTKRAHQRDALAALLWGEMSDADAKNNLRQALSNLRKFLDPYLLVTRDTVQFNAAAPHTLDVDEFVKGVQASPQISSQQSAINNQQSPISSLTQSLNLYSGDFLHGIFVREAPEFEDWAYAERVRLRELAFQALQTLTTHHQQRGAYPQAIQTATRLLTFDPWREETHRQLMLLYARSGQRTAALAQYEQCRRVLAKELDVDPSAETTALYERIRAAGDTFPNNLTLRPTAFVGRTHELEHLDSLFTRPDSRLITLLGPGGIGKTRLALQAARHALQRGLFLSGVFFVPLEGVDNPELIPTALAEAVGLAFAGNQDPKTQVLTYLKSREILLILDNVEHLLDAVPWLVHLLQNAPRAQLLVTSRERLNVQWEWTVPVEGLDYPTRDTTPEQAAQTGAVQLFTARAQAARPDFALTPDKLPAIVRICQLLSGTPLALELAAANIRYYTCAEIETEIAQNFDFLTANFRDLPTRQRSLRAVFDYSWRLLTPPEQRTFAALSVFRGGFTADGARQVAGATAPLLAGLGDKSLLRRDEQGRFHLHEMLRQFAAERLEDAHGQQDAHLRHAEHFLALAEKAETEFHGDQQEAWLTRLEMEHNNLRGALEWGRETRALTLYARLAGALWPFWYLRSYYREGFGWLEPALAHMDDLPAQVQSKLLRGAGVMANQLGDYDRAIDYLSKNLALQRELGESIPLARALNGLAVTYHAIGNYPPARALWEECLPLQRAAGDRIGMAQTLQNLSALELDEGNYARVLELGTEGLKIFREEGIKWGIAYVSINLGTCLLEQGDLPNARLHIMESLTLCREFGSQDTIADCLDVLAGVEIRENQPGRAVMYLAASDKIRAELGNQRHAGGILMYEQMLTNLKAHLGETEFKTNWNQSVALDTDGLLDRIQKGDLDELTPPQPSKRADPPTTNPKSDTSFVVGTSVPSPQIPPPPQTGTYILENLLARGGMGEVFRGRDTQTGQSVAIKRLLPHLLTQNPDALARFQREADLLRQLNHPNIVKILSTQVENGEYLLVMEYVPGGSLRDLLDQTPVLPLAQTLRLALELADALARAHHLGIIHRDLKPANILLAADGSPRLADFGIARLTGQNTRLTEDGAAVGTIAYMSPEACIGEDLDARADVWSFGVLLHEMLTGKNPFERAHYTATLTAVLHQPAPTLAATHPVLPPALTGLVQRLLVKDRDQRPASMRQIAAELEQIAQKKEG
ncbi:MAG: protein kinase [Anaerolineales bacterium]|nr:protein kinase [Anaerolineales bacterium]